MKREEHIAELGEEGLSPIRWNREGQISLAKKGLETQKRKEKREDFLSLTKVEGRLSPL